MTDTKPPLAALRAPAFLLAAMALAAAPWGCGGDDREAAPTARVRRGRFKLVVSENCEFKPLHSWTVLSRASDKIDWIVAEGSHVKRGDLVFSQDTTWVQDWLTRDTNELDAARRSLKEVARQVQMERDELRLDLQSSASAVQLARTRLASVIAGPGAEDLAEARAVLAAARTAAKDKRAAATAAAALVKKGFLSEAEAEKERVAARNAEIDAQRKELQFERLKAGATKYWRKIAELELERARVQLEMAKADAERREAQLVGRISNARARVASLQRNVGRAKRNLAERKISAMGAGVVIYRNTHWHRQSKPEVGSRVWKGCGVMDIADVSKMKVRTQLAERHVRHLKVGSVIRVKPDPLPGTVLEARVTWIDRWSRDRSADLAKADRAKEGLSGVKVFALEAAVTTSDLRIKPGFKGKAEFPLVSLADALIVPTAAVFGSGDERYVLPVTGGQARRVPVEVIVDDGKEAAVRGPLEEGQELVTRNSM
jgi:multidrug resistance efflux pump